MTISLQNFNPEFTEICISCKEACTKLYPGKLCPDCYELDRQASYERNQFNLKTFDSFKTNDNNIKVVEKIKNFINNPKGIYLYGNTGTGKTHLAYALYYLLNYNKYNITFKNITELILELRQCIQLKMNRSELDVINNILENEYIILDDLGAENLTGYSSESLYYLFNKMVELNKKVFITSNLSIKDLSSQKQNDRLPSRICELCDILQITGSDYRIQRMLK